MSSSDIIGLALNMLNKKLESWNLWIQICDYRDPLHLRFIFLWYLNEASIKICLVIFLFPMPDIKSGLLNRLNVILVFQIQ